MDEEQQYELETLVEELEGYRGRHTELIMKKGLLARLKINLLSGHYTFYLKDS